MRFQGFLCSWSQNFLAREGAPLRPELITTMHVNRRDFSRGRSCVKENVQSLHPSEPLLLTKSFRSIVLTTAKAIPHTKVLLVSDFSYSLRSHFFLCGLLPNWDWPGIWSLKLLLLPLVRSYKVFPLSKILTHMYSFLSARSSCLLSSHLLSFSRYLKSYGFHGQPR